jgi:hypothetical protein
MFCARCLKRFPNTVVRCDECGSALEYEKPVSGLILKMAFIAIGLFLVVAVIKVIYDQTRSPGSASTGAAESTPLQGPYIGMQYSAFSSFCEADVHQKGDDMTYQHGAEFTAVKRLASTPGRESKMCVGTFTFVNDKLVAIAH